MMEWIAAHAKEIRMAIVFIMGWGIIFWVILRFFQNATDDDDDDFGGFVAG